MLLEKPDAKLEKGLRGFLAMAPLCVFSKWYTTVLVDLLHEEREPIEWRSLHVGAERGVNREHRQALLTNTLLVVAGGPLDRFGTRVLQIQLGVQREFGREDGVRHGQALSGIEDSQLDRSSRTRGGGSAG